MREHAIALALCAAKAAVGTGLAEAPPERAEGPGRKLEDATAAYRELISASDNAVPTALPDNAKCVARPAVIKTALRFAEPRMVQQALPQASDAGTSACFLSSGGAGGLAHHRGDALLESIHQHIAL